MTAPIDPVEDAASRLGVFLANRNHAPFLAASIEGLLNQTVTPAEIQIVDDASTDESRDIISRYAAKHSIIKPVFLPENRGVVANMVRFVADSDAEYVYFAASDDVTMPNLLEESLRLLIHHPEAGLCSSLCRLMDEDGHDLGPYKSFIPPSELGYIPPNRVAQLLMNFDTWMIGNATVYRNKALRSIGNFDTSLHGFTDGFASRAIALGSGAVFVEKELSYWRKMNSGQAAITNTEPALVHHVAAKALQLMSTTQADRFPQAYGKVWKNRWIYGALTSCLRGTPENPWPAIEAILSPAYSMDALAISLCRNLGELGRMAFELYLIFRLRAKDLMMCLSPTKINSLVRRKIIALKNPGNRPHG
ncbi:MAG: glycosyltransferase [Rhodospirillales bacterium]|jgi:glycosyltransferase involved in cell wall biosynthesis|nr:glycosyltransferase [Rhodospirillales bacterium]MBT5075891.1 glycosyltransferase [Rhodospirillales bacterium]MBT5113793.1 glycosyltransferase [Rhodospirillales bacterium]MBT5672321.1 glycosyltransferase [Rhodospirillales bacterium]MBT6186010.1 glycosyltransferase [Rhodospirillales bacterium]